MISVDLSIKRNSGLWAGVSTATVEQYRREMKDLATQINSFINQHILLVSPELVRKVQGSIKEELDYCNYYDEYSRRCQEPNFNQWVLIPQKDAPDQWQKAPGEQWVRGNCRVKAVIQFDRTSSMVKLTLEYENDSSTLSFYEKPYAFKMPIAHLRNEQKIAEIVEVFKRDADRFLEDHLYPAGVRTDFDILKQLLHI